MLKAGRFEKTPERNLADLDDHLYLLKEDLAKLVGGDAAYAKKIASALRTLACLSSGTEGLLWRVAAQLGADDGVDLQASTGIDLDNPLTRGLSFALIPVFLAGQAPSDCPFPPEHISLKKLIKEYDALYCNGKSYTHEQLISAIAQQIGLSHESEDVAPYLIDLSGIAMSDRPALADFLITDATLILEIGERVLEFASTQSGFVRHARPEIVIPPRTVHPFKFSEDEHFFGRDAIMDKEGTQFWVLPVPNANWEDDGQSYNLGTLQFRKFRSTAIKHSDGTLEVTVHGFGLTPQVKRLPIISRGKPNIPLCFTWKDGICTIYIDGRS